MSAFLVLLGACGLVEPFLESTTGILTITSTPAGAAIFLDGTDLGLVTPAVLDGLIRGRHVVRVFLAGHSADPDSVAVLVVASDTTEAAFTLTSIYGSIAVTSAPSGAAIILDGTATGQATPATLADLAEGDHVVRVFLAGHAATPESVTVTVRATETAVADFTLVEVPGGLSVTSTPAGAAIILDGNPTGQATPATLTGLAQGEHVVRVALAGYTAVPESVVVDILPDQTAAADFTLVEIPGNLSVTSDPAGAGIILDGADTGEVTPAVLMGLTQGSHVVRVELAGYSSDPESLLVTIFPEQTATAHFTLTEVVTTAPKVVLLEAFSNVSCTGCPEMAAALHELMASAGHGTDRVLLIKYSMAWPQASDPHYLANTADNDARGVGPNFDGTGYYADYMMGGIPTLAGDGSLLGASGNPPELPELAALVDGLLTADPGFAVGVAASIAGTIVPVTVTLTATRPVDLAGLSLHVALVENPIVYTTPPGSEGELEFHWVMRDFATATTDVGALVPGSPHQLNLDLTRRLSWIAGNLYVIAFVQNDLTREILQAGSNAGGVAPLHSSLSGPMRSGPPPAPHGGNQP